MGGEQGSNPPTARAPSTAPLTLLTPLNKVGTRARHEHTEHTESEHTESEHTESEHTESESSESSSTSEDAKKGAVVKTRRGLGVLTCRHGVPLQALFLLSAERHAYLHAALITLLTKTRTPIRFLSYDIGCMIRQGIQELKSFQPEDIKDLMRRARRARLS